MKNNKKKVDNKLKETIKENNFFKKIILSIIILALITFHC